MIKTIGVCLRYWFFHLFVEKSWKSIKCNAIKLLNINPSNVQCLLCYDYVFIEVAQHLFLNFFYQKKFETVGDFAII